MNKIKLKMNSNNFDLSILELIKHYQKFIIKKILINLLILIVISLSIVPVLILKSDNIKLVNFLSYLLLILGIFLFLKAIYWTIRFFKVKKIKTIIISSKNKSDMEIDKIMNLFYIISVTLFDKNVSDNSFKAWDNKLKKIDNNDNSQIDRVKLWTQYWTIYNLTPLILYNMDFFFILNVILFSILFILFFIPLILEIIWNKINPFKIKNNEIVSQNFQQLDDLFWEKITS